ncbi:hypothetical protein PHMEG_00035224 [Phytophthora megakarya]|uniref:HAT C-terminal dimerisation domain-containing protein n=1 Tax=Phytophthora megakarya TaxID=4795 RepID=A0A225UP73_9STRA|nr:hypothetical protein PHMEG_00035224 [Phytophthora megakarya]
MFALAPPPRIVCSEEQICSVKSLVLSMFNRAARRAESKKNLTDASRCRDTGAQSNGMPQSVLEFWQSQEETNTYHFLARVARVLFAVPSSSAAIERDFRRSILSTLNEEMCSFLNRNRQLTEITKCKVLTDEEHKSTVPSSMLVDVELHTETYPNSEWEVPMMSFLFLMRNPKEIEIN